jgi:hypothetical protein
MRLGRRARLGTIALLGGGVVLVLLGPLVALAQDTEAVEVDIDNAGCFGHHAAETPPFRTTVLLVPAPFQEVPAGQEFDFPVQVQVAWKQEMRNLKVALNLSQAPNLAFVGEKEPLDQEQDGSVSPDGEAEFPFPVEDTATEVVVTLAGQEGPLGGVDLDLFVVAPGGNATYNKTIEDNSLNGVKNKDPVAHEELRIDQAKILDGGSGEWKALIHYDYQPTAGPPTDAPFHLSAHVYYNASRSAENFVPVGRTLPAGGLANVTFRLKALAQGPATIGVRSLGWAHYVHTDAQAVDDGNFSKTQSFPLQVGTTFRVARTSGGPLVDIGFDPVTKLMRQWGFLLGWTGFFLIGPSLLLGGTFGGGSVRWLNARTGTARQRVLWHNALSYVLLGIGLTHMTLFLVEQTYNWTVGIVWGSLTLASMVGLGFTGALQNRIAKAWGYATWRFTHFLLGMLVIVFITLHVVVDGVDLQFVRDVFL